MCLALLLFIGLAGCDSLADADAPLGRVQVLLTDAPLDGVAEANVTITRVELVGADSLAPVVLADSAQGFNLLELQHGVTAPLADVAVPAGRYQQLRLVVANDAELVLHDGSTKPLKVPSGATSGIKILLPDFEIDDENDVVSMTIDFDASRSFVEAGASGKVLFKPVLKPLSLTVNGAEQDLGPADDEATTEGS